MNAPSPRELPRDSIGHSPALPRFDGGYPLIPEARRDVLAGLLGEIASLPMRLADGPAFAAARLARSARLNCYQDILVLADQIELPMQAVAITKSLVSEMTAVFSSAEQPARSLDRIMRALFNQRPEHVTSFSLDSLNRYNTLYYQTRDACANADDFFNVRPQLQRGVMEFLAHYAPLAEPFRVKELCAGAGWDPKWRYLPPVVQGRSIELTVCDLAAPKVPDWMRHHPELLVRSEAMNLLSPLHPLPDNSKLHAVVCYYGFDSIWFPGDINVAKAPNTPWCEALYRVAVPDWHSHRPHVIEGFRSGDAGRLRADDFRELVIERALRPLDLRSRPDLQQLLGARIGEGASANISVPLGVANYIAQLFEHQIAPGGVLLLGEVGTAAPCYYDFHTTAVAGKFRGIDVPCLSALLHARGLKLSYPKVDPLRPFASQGSATVLIAIEREG